MVNYSAALDLIQRRVVMQMEKDDIHKCFITCLDNECMLTLICKENLSQSQLSKLTMKYSHIFADQEVSYIVVILPRENHFIRTPKTIEIWNDLVGFCG